MTLPPSPMPPEANQNRTDKSQEQPKPKLDNRIDAKLEGAQTKEDVNGAAKDVADTGVQDADQVSQNARNSVFRLAGFTKEQFNALGKNGLKLPSLPAGVNIDDAKVGAQAVGHVEITQGAIDATDAAKKGVDEVKTHVLKARSFDDLKTAGKVAAGAAVDTVRAGVEPAATRAAGAIGEKKGSDAASDIPVIGGALKDKAGKIGKKTGEQAAKSALDAVQALAKQGSAQQIDEVAKAVSGAADTISPEQIGKILTKVPDVFQHLPPGDIGKIIQRAPEQAAEVLKSIPGHAADILKTLPADLQKELKKLPNVQDILKNRPPEKAREGVERTKQQELRELIGKYHQSKNEKVQKDFDVLFANLEPQRAQAMINVYKTMNPQEQQRFMEKMHTDADVFAKMTPQGRERCARLLAATPEEREKIMHSLPKKDLAKVRNLYVNDREGWNKMTEFYNRTDALASGQVRDAAGSAHASNAKTLEHDEAASGNVPHVRSGVRPNFDAAKGKEHIAKGDEGAGREDGVAVGRMESRPATVSQVERVPHKQNAREHGHEQKIETANPKLVQEVQDLLGKYGERVKNAVSKISTATLQTIMETKERSPALGIALDKILTKGSDTLAKLSESGVTFMTKFLFESADQIQSEFSSLSQADQEAIVGLVKSIPDNDIGILPKKRVAAILNFEKQRK